jgi:predicted Zn-dependent protease
MSPFHGTYTDGQTGHRREVTANLGAAGLNILDADGRFVAEWPYESLRLVEEVYAGQPVRLKEGRRGIARLTFVDHTILDALADKSRHLGRRDYRRHNTARRAAIWAGALVVTVVGFIYGLPLVAEPIAAIVPLKWEEALGRSVRKQAMTLLAGRAKVCTRNSEGRAALNRLVARLSGTVKTRYRFRVVVVDHPLVNAFAAPGGYVIVFRGLIDKTPTAEGFAGVLAHEMGHVIERHGTEAIVKAIGLGMVFGAIVGDSSSIGSAARDLAADLMTKSYSRSAEREADRIGVTMLNRANIRGDGFADFFNRVAKMQGPRGGVSSYFATHPSSTARAKRVRQMATGRGPAMSPADWRAIRAICR